MYTIHNSSTLYINEIIGSDTLYSGLTPEIDGYGNGPYKTVEHALRIIRDQRKTGVTKPMTIALASDIHLAKAVNIGSEVTDITIESYGERKRIIGGTRVENWRHDVFNGVSCFSAEAPKKPDGSMADFTDLYVNGSRATTTRYPKHGTLRAVETEERKHVNDRGLTGHSRWFIAHREDVESIDNIEDAIVNYYHFWIDEHSPVESFDKESCNVTMRYPSRFSLTAMYEQRAWSDMYYYLSNVPNTFSEPGEWYLKRESGRVYYIPRNENETPESIEAYTPIAEEIFNIEGSDVRLRDLEITVTTCDYKSCYVVDPETKLLVKSDVIYGGDGQSVSSAPGAINVKNATRVSISDCYIHSLGIYAIAVGEACRRIRIENNLIEDVAAGGIKICGGPLEAAPEMQTGDCLISHNEIRHIGKRYEAGCGILICHAHDNEISYNEIHDGGYSGISVGWVWGYADSVTCGNVIRANHIYNLGNGTLSDMGGIYLLGKQHGTVVSENRIHDITCENYGAWGIYLDEGSSFVTVESNVVYATKEECFDLHYGSQNVVRNNIFVGTSGHFPIRTSKNELHPEVLFEKNVIVTSGSSVYNSKSGVNTFASRDNFFWSINEKDPVIFVTQSGEPLGLKEWQSLYHQDAGSLLVNPAFASVADYDFTPSPSSAIYSHGFRRIPEYVTRPSKKDAE